MCIKILVAIAHVPPSGGRREKRLSISQRMHLGRMQAVKQDTELAGNGIGKSPAAEMVI
ncbi:MAG: hypothetical protein LUF25_03010 [Phascolarctobacterium sp.]|nr:hypothetical protein [Phascolarctobacterium sp.]